MPDEHFDHAEFVKEEFGQGSRIRPKGVGWFWWWVAVLLVLAFAASYLAQLS